MPGAANAYIVHPSNANSVVVKVTQKRNWIKTLAPRGFYWTKTILGYACALLVLVDTVTNNWEIIDYVGNAKHLLTPMIDLHSGEELKAAFVFPYDFSPNKASEVGRYMIDFTHDRCTNENHEDKSYILTMGSHKILSEHNDICPDMKKSYPVGNNVSHSLVKLGVIIDGITFIRGSTLSHLFGNTASEPFATGSMTDIQLREMDYHPGRLGTDMRLTNPIKIPPIGASVTTNITMFRFFPKAFCTGCQPNIELGMDTCLSEYTYNGTHLNIHRSNAHIGGYHDLGIIMKRHGSSVISLYIRALAVLIVVGGFTASQKTIRWTEAVPLSFFDRMMRKIAPPVFRHPCSVFKLPMFCLNSDIFVFLYVIAVIMDDSVAMIYCRVVYRWSQHAGPDIGTTLRLISMQFRWLWFNCLITKSLKWFCNFVSQTSNTGTNKVVGFLNFSSVTSLYIGVLFLLHRDDFIEYGNHVKTDLTTCVQNLDGIEVNFFESWFIREMPEFASLMVLNVILVLALDHIIYYKWWRKMSQNSLVRQHMYNSTSVLTEFCGVEFVKVDSYKGTALSIPARSLCTLQWFLSSHLLCFGLSEQQTWIRALKSTNISVSNKKDNSDEGTSSSGSSGDDNMDQLVVKTEVGDAPVKAASIRDLSIIMQDRDGFVRMFDTDKHEMQSLGIEVKILRDTKYVIA